MSPQSIPIYLGCTKPQCILERTKVPPKCAKHGVGVANKAVVEAGTPFVMCGVGHLAFPIFSEAFS